VDVALRSSNPTDIPSISGPTAVSIVDPPSTLAWNLPRTITLEARQNASGTATIDLAFSDSGYDGVTAQVTVNYGTSANIPGTNLRRALEGRLGKSEGELILREEIAGLTGELRLRDNIADLTGLEHATGVTFLNIASNNISSLTPLSGLTALTRIDLNGNPISDLRGLPNNLQRLDLVNARVSDVSPLSGLTSLQRLFLRNEEGITSNAIVDVSPLANLTNLTTLDLQRNNIADISSLDDNPGLAMGNTISLQGNPLNLAAYTTHIPALQGFQMNDDGTLNGMVNFDPFSGICDRTDAVETAILAAIPGNVACGGVTIAQLGAITTLNLNNQSLTTLQSGDFAGLTGLTGVALNNNNLTSLPADLFDGLTSLETLFLNDNNLTGLPENVFNGLTSLR